MPGFTPPGMIATAAQQRAAGRGARTGGRRRKRARVKATAGTRRAKKRSGKPRPGTKAWMTYIRGKRGKKRK